MPSASYDATHLSIVITNPEIISIQGSPDKMAAITATLGPTINAAFTAAGVSATILNVAAAYFGKYDSVISHVNKGAGITLDMPWQAVFTQNADGLTALGRKYLPPKPPHYPINDTVIIPTPRPQS